MVTENTIFMTELNFEGVNNEGYTIEEALRIQKK